MSETEWEEARAELDRTLGQLRSKVAAIALELNGVEPHPQAGQLASSAQEMIERRALDLGDRPRDVGQIFDHVYEVARRWVRNFGQHLLQAFHQPQDVSFQIVVNIHPRTIGRGQR